MIEFTDEEEEYDWEDHNPFEFNDMLGNLYI